MEENSILSINTFAGLQEFLEDLQKIGELKSFDGALLFAHFKQIYDSYKGYTPRYVLERKTVDLKLRQIADDYKFAEMCLLLILESNLSEEKKAEVNRIRVPINNIAYNYDRMAASDEETVRLIQLAMGQSNNQSSQSGCLSSLCVLLISSVAFLGVGCYSIYHLIA